MSELPPNRNEYPVRSGKRRSRRVGRHPRPQSKFGLAAGYIDEWYFRQIAFGMLTASTLKLLLILYGPGEPIASTAGVVVAVVAVLACELLARRSQLVRVTPHPLALVIGCLACASLLTLGGGFHVGSGAWSCVLFIVASVLVIIFI
jgi:hypothetical protein